MIKKNSLPTIVEAHTVLSSSGQKCNNSPNSPLWLRMCQEQWSCMGCRECHSMAGPYECPKVKENTFCSHEVYICIYLNISMRSNLKPLLFDHSTPTCWLCIMLSVQGPRTRHSNREPGTLSITSTLSSYSQHLVTERVSAECPTWSLTHDRSRVDEGIWFRKKDVKILRKNDKREKSRQGN